MNRPVTLLPSSRSENQSGERSEISPSDEEFKPVQRDVEGLCEVERIFPQTCLSPDAPGCVESLDMTDELESALSQTAEPTGEEEVKKTKKNKKKKNNNNSEINVDSSADDFKEVEVKPKKKKNKKQPNTEEKESEPTPIVTKEKTPEPEIKEKTPENDSPPQPVPRKLKNKKKEEEEKAKKEEEQLAEEFVGFESEEAKFEGFDTSKSPESFIPVESPTVEETATAMFEEFSKKSPPTKDDVSPNRDLVEFSEEEPVVRVIEADEDAEEDDKVEFFIKEKSSSVEPDNDMTSSGIDPMAARPNPWFEKFLKKGSSMIEDQIFGAVKKYEDVDEKGSEDEGMEELEKNQADTEKNIADLLEDDEDPIEPPAPEIIESQPPSSNLSQLLKGESSKKSHVDDSSDDDFMFRPVPQQKKNKKQKKQKGQVLSLEEFHR